MHTFTEQELAQRFGCSVEQIRAQHADNGRALRRMLEKAVRTRKKVNGYSAAQLAVMLTETEQRAKATK